MASAAPQAQAIIGEESLTIGGGNSVGGTMNEIEFSKEFSESGFSPEVIFAVVIRIAAWITAGYSRDGKLYNSKIATARNLTFRVDKVIVGQSFVRVGLKEKERS